MSLEIGDVTNLLEIHHIGCLVIADEKTVIVEWLDLTIGVDRVSFGGLRHQLEEDGPVAVDGLVKEKLTLVGWLRCQELNVGDEDGILSKQVVNCPGEDLGSTLK